MISAEKSVYISYSWGAEKRHPLVDELLAALAEKGISVKRDSNAINYGDSIRTYMDELAAGRAIILVLSEEYFKSPNCMYELREIYLNNRKDFRKSIFPVVLKDAPLHSPEDQILYIDYWEKKTKEFDNNLDLISKRNVSHDLLSKLKDYDDFAKMIGELQSLISDMYCPKEEELRKTGFSALIERMFSQSEPDGGGGTDKTGNAAKIGQHTIGNGNVFSGSGNVTVNNININAAETAPPKETYPKKSPAKLGMLHNHVPDLPPNYFPRPDDLKEFRAVLLAEGTQAVGITGKRQHVGVQGMGGLGKSVLAAALAHDEEVRAAFPDGIFWLRFRQDADNAYLLEQQAEILKILKSEQLPDTLAYGENLLNLALQDKRCLFIADDLWDSKHLRHFNIKSSGCRFLLTTRNAEVIKKTGAHKCELGLLDEKQARAFLALSSGCAENALPDEAAAILRECGRLPLAVAAIGSMVKGKPAQRWQMALERLQNAHLDKIPANLTDDYNYKSLFKVFAVSVEDLPPEVQAYYKTLVIFPEDAKIPESVLQLYWEHCPQGDYDPLDAVDLLVERSLLNRDKDEFVTLHDLLRDYLRHQSGGDIANLHKDLLEAYKAKYPGGWHMIPYNESFWPEKPASYFYMKWKIHARGSCDPVFGEEIADDLIMNQPYLSPLQLEGALEFVRYKYIDIAPILIKKHKSSLVLIECLNLLGDEAKKEAKRFLKESNDTRLLNHCLRLLGDEAKEEAWCLLQSNKDEWLQVTCIRTLGKEANEYAKQLLKKSKDSSVVTVCLNMLGIEAEEEAKHLLRERKEPNILTACLDILGGKAKEDARKLLKFTKNEWLLLACIRILGKEAEDIVLHLIETTIDEDIRNMCLDELDSCKSDQINRTRRGEKSFAPTHACIHNLGLSTHRPAGRTLAQRFSCPSSTIRKR